MTLLPIVDRELRVAARRGATYWSRVIAAVLAMLVATGTVILLHASKGMLGVAGGSILFGILKWMAFICVCLAGVFLTSDCLSEEKREGTLGLLFLTDLRGYDVVLGKLLAGSLRAAFGLLAVFPVMALTLMMGGVSGREFWQMMLILCNSLFFSLAAGVFISSISRESLKAMNGTLLLCAFFIGFLPLADWAMAGWNSSSFKPVFSLASPGYSFGSAGAFAPPTFWLNLAVIHGVAWVFLGLSSLCAPRAWQEKSNAPKGNKDSFRHRWRFGEPHRRALWRRRWLEYNPVIWLSGRDRWLERLLWLVLGLGLAIWGALFYLSIGRQDLIGFGQALTYIVALALDLWMASQASRFFFEARRNGALELMLVTPLTVRGIVDGHWQVIRRQFLAPVLVVVALKLLLGVLQLMDFQATRAPAAGTSPGALTWMDDWMIWQMINVVVGIVVFVADIVALAWFGMWMGVRSSKANLAVIKTLVFALVLPWLGLAFAQGMMMFLGAFTGAVGGRVLFWVPAVIVGAAGLAKDAAFIVWSRRRLHTALRQEASGGTRPTPARPPLLPPPPMPPGGGDKTVLNAGPKAME